MSSSPFRVFWIRLREAIDVLRGNAHVTTSEAEGFSRTPSTSSRTTTKIPILSMNIPKGVMAIANILPSSASQNTINIAIGEHCFVLPHGVVVLAAWRQTLDATTRCRIDAPTESTNRLLTNVGLTSVVNEGVRSPATAVYPGRLPLRAVTNEFVIARAVSHIATTFFTHFHDLGDPLKRVLSELCSNVIAHSDTERPGYICGSTLREGQPDGGARPVAHVAIADTGIGIRQSYMDGQNEEAKKLIDDGTSPLHLAINGLYSSKREYGAAPAGLGSAHYGSGLFVVRRLIEENGGSMYLLSGQESVYLRRSLSHGGYFMPEPELVEPEYQGTFVGLKFYLDDELPFEEVQQEFAEKLTK